MRKLMVIGGSGFIGHHLIRRRLAERDWRIVSVDIKPPRERLEGVEYVAHDVRQLTTLEGHGDTQIIYNFAAVHTTPGHPFWEYYDTNVRGATETIAFARRHNIAQIVFTSSISVYGASEDQKDETSLPDPNSAYGWSKLLSEGVFISWHNATPGSRLLIVRPAVVFGEGENGNFTRLAKLLARGVFVYPGRKDTVKACIYVKDLLDYIEEMWERGERLTLFNGAYAERYQLHQVVAEMKKYFPKVREFTIPAYILMAAARGMMVLPNGIGIHPERILKLVNSTNIYPHTLMEAGVMEADPLPTALKDWHDSTDGRFR
jgi:nucleoside-diphosphate-sugar epimerase